MYELAIGKRAFQRGSAPETMTAIIREDAEPLPGNVPAPLRWVIERLLAKEPAERYDSTRDLYSELRQIRDRLSQATSAQTSTAAVSTRRRKRSLILAAGALACLAAGSVLTLLLIPPPRRLPICRLTSLRRSPEPSPRSVLLNGRRTARASHTPRAFTASCRSSPNRLAHRMPYS